MSYQNQEEVVLQEGRQSECCRGEKNTLLRVELCATKEEENMFVTENVIVCGFRREGELVPGQGNVSVNKEGRTSITKEVKVSVPEGEGRSTGIVVLKWSEN